MVLAKLWCNLLGYPLNKNEKLKEMFSIYILWEMNKKNINKEPLTIMDKQVG